GRGRWRHSSSAPKVESWIVPAGSAYCHLRRITVRVSERIPNVLHVLSLIGWAEHIRLKRKIAFTGWLTVASRVAAELFIKVKARRLLVWRIERCSRIKLLSRRCIRRINSIICLVTLQRGRHGGDFGFGAGPSAFPLHITRRGQNQTGQDDDDGDDDQKLDESESALGAELRVTNAKFRRNDRMTNI